jgi:dissimilatory sulfite reductase (desulfoviridin) alpha/beta subunit
VEYCKERAIVIKRGISVLNPDKCVQCGVCVSSCPFDLLKADDRHYLILVGGRRGRHPRIGRELLTLENEDLVIHVIEKIVNWVYRRAWSGRLLSEQLDDLQFEKFRQDILHEIAEKTVKPDSTAV